MNILSNEFLIPFCFSKIISMKDFCNKKGHKKPARLGGTEHSFLNLNLIHNFEQQS